MVVPKHRSVEPPGRNAGINTSITPNEDIAKGHGKEYPTGPNIGVQPIEEIGRQDSGDDHDGRKLV